MNYEREQIELSLQLVAGIDTGHEVEYMCFVLGVWPESGMDELKRRAVEILTEVIFETAFQCKVNSPNQE